MKKAEPNPKANRHILVITYGMAAVFAAMIFYFGYFLQVKSESVINNSYNARLDHFSDRVVRGEILGNGGEVLARTRIGEDDSEVREYPYGSLFAHAVGYSTKGKTGLEALGNFYLLSSHVNLLEQAVNELSSVKNPGDHIVTTLDVGLQKAAYDALGDRNGAVVVMETGTGRILAMVSKPDYDPNMLDTIWDSLISEDNDTGQLLNRATQGLYPPGSIFKIITLLEYMRENPDTYGDYSFDCDGSYENDTYTIQCYHKTAHGQQNLKLAFANSCNGAFAELGLSLDLRKLQATAVGLGFNRDLPLAVASNSSSYVLDPDAGLWQVLQTSIGQGQTQMTPMHNCLVTAAVANGGTLMRPYFIEQVVSAGGDLVKSFGPEAVGEWMSAEESAALTEYMRAVVTDGTGSAVRTDAYTVAGKTGSAEFDAKKETHAWFTGFAPAENPEIAVTVVVEEGGSGGKAAAPIARAVFDLYFSR